VAIEASDFNAFQHAAPTDPKTLQSKTSKSHPFPQISTLAVWNASTGAFIGNLSNPAAEKYTGTFAAPTAFSFEVAAMVIHFPGEDGNYRIMSDMERSKSGWNASCRTRNVRSRDGTHHVGHGTFEVEMERIMSDIERSKSRWSASCQTWNVRSPDETIMSDIERFKSG
jgi:hypothetical protein